MKDEGRPAVQRKDLDWPTYLALCGAGLVLALTWLGPRPSEGLGTVNSLLFWSAHVGPALILLSGAQVLLGRLFGTREVSGLAQVALAGALGAVLFTPVALVLDVLFGAPASVDSDADPLLLRAVQEFAQLVGPVVLVWILINAPSLVRLAVPRGDQGVVEGPERIGGPDGESAIWDRVPKGIGREVVAMSAELHYLRIYSRNGDALILFPFERAVEIMNRRRGLQVHRSHWVSLDHVEEVDARNGRMVLGFRDGLCVPVSRRYQKDVRQSLRPAASD